jgi:hypothetical protein
VPGVAGDRFGSVADGYAAYRKGFPVETLDLWPATASAWQASGWWTWGVEPAR